jgi:phosphoesterase RecJ-like protein
MALNESQQALEHIKRAKHILVVSRAQATPDTMAGAVACYLFLKQLNKSADVLIPGLHLEHVPDFLPARTEIKSSVGAMRALKIYLDVSQTPVNELMYDVRNNQLEIIVQPKSGEWKGHDVKAKHGEDYYDLIIALDCSDQHALGDWARTHADFLFRTTIVNIDCDATNERWGQINLVDLNMVCTCETLFHLFESWDAEKLNQDLATALLAGMLAKTKSFRTPNLTPRTLNAAAQLISRGARREEIVHGLWRKHNVATLKLWGRALTRLNHDPTLNLVWTFLTKQDFIETGAPEHHLHEVISELVVYAPEAKVIALFYESAESGAAHLSLHAQPPYHAAELTREFGATGTRESAQIKFNSEKNLSQLIPATMDRLREIIKATSK